MCKQQYRGLAVTLSSAVVQGSRFRPRAVSEDGLLPAFDLLHYLVIVLL